ncbi:hypothetical protein M3M33_17630, partial [Loigolactobacillus coryniformis]|uniref:hypothetical protein n=1 Tax=Loigolactobacillus coryniformis TaxID=1610 RepID=UPI00201A62BF
AKQKEILAGKAVKLVKEIDELQKKTSLSAEQAKTLKTRMNELADISPNFVTQYDKMGNAINITADAMERANKAAK